MIPILKEIYDEALFFFPVLGGYLLGDSIYWCLGLARETNFDLGGGNEASHRLHLEEL